MSAALGRAPHILSVSSGLMVGPEGPLVHSGACVASGMTRGGKNFRWWHSEKVRQCANGRPAAGFRPISPPYRERTAYGLVGPSARLRRAAAVHAMAHAMAHARREMLHRTVSASHRATFGPRPKRF